MSHPANVKQGKTETYYGIRMPEQLIHHHLQVEVEEEGVAGAGEGAEEGAEPETIPFLKEQQLGMTHRTSIFMSMTSGPLEKWTRFVNTAMLRLLKMNHQVFVAKKAR